ncbi:MAG TPA: hydrogenase maturation nickel metallochaperone HypA [Dehalococcoidia bacterium]|nr:hydrogenase maturation nickel metallochaperone HypA [Dehalococcoidia bacterium]
MHEYTVTESLLKIVQDKASEAGVEKVLKVHIVVGPLTGFVPDCIRFYYETLSKGTIGENATLEFEEAPIRLHCRQCGEEFTPESREWSCPSCGSTGVDISGGRELFIKEMEVQ